jgi:hypothetical protein
VAEIVRQLMAKYPAERFQTPSELAAALAPFAVSGPTLWVIPPSGGPFSEMRATPAASQTPAPVPHSDPLDTDDESVLLGTLPPNLSPTSLSAAGRSSSSHLSPALAKEQHRRLRIALFWAFGIVGGLVAAAALLSRWL